MTTENEQKPRKMPKGGRKGGTVFPRVALSDAITYARKLVSKTHSSPQPRDVIYSGVVGAKAGIGDVRISALKQYGFLNGGAKINYSAGELAKRIAAAPTEELIPLYREAVLKPTVFKKLFDTYHGDTVSKGKLKQRAADLKVHPDETTTCVEHYVSSMITAELVTVEGDQVKHLSSKDISSRHNVLALVDASSETALVREDTAEGHMRDDEGVVAPQNENEGEEATPSSPRETGRENTPGPRAVFNVNVSLDSSLDIEKLQKQLELLKRYGAI